MAIYLWIAIGSALGGMGRFALNNFVSERLGAAFPLGNIIGTLLINVIGSLAIGFFYTLTSAGSRWVVAEEGRIFFMVGICGGFTTFSAFSLQTLNLFRSGDWLRGGGYVVASVVLCLLAVWLGHVAAALMNSTRAS